MHNTTGSRLAGIFLGLAAIATIVGLGAQLVARPLVEVEIRRLLQESAGEFAGLSERLGQREFSQVVAARAAVDAARGIEYALRAPGGAMLAGTLPDETWRMPAEDEELRIDLRRGAGARGAGRRLLGRRIQLADGAELIVAYDVDSRIRYDARILVSLLIGIVATALGGALIASLFARRTSLRIASIRLALERLRAGDLSQRLPVAGVTGLDRISAEFNRALERIEQLSVAMRAAADSTAHDLRTPLTRLRAALELAMTRESDPAQLRAALERVLAEADRLQMTLDALLRISLAESGTAQLEPVDLRAIIGGVVELYRPLAEERGQRVEWDAAGPCTLLGNGQLLAQALANLLDNAIKFTPRDGLVTLRVAERGATLVVEVADNGAGIAPGDRQRALERSRRLPNAVGTPGSGLGLSLVVAVARLHGAQFVLDDNAPGLCARLVFSRS